MAQVRGQDTAIGMTEEQMGKIFEDFAQAEGDATAKFGALGLASLSRNSSSK